MPAAAAALPLPDNGSHAMFVVNVVLPTTAAVFVAARILTKWSFRQVFGGDDWAIVASLGFAVAQSVLQCLEIKNGFGKHIFDIPHDHLVTALKIFVAVQVTYKASITLTKISILLLYRRIFVLPRFTKIVWCLMIFCAVFGFASSLVTIFQCTPIRRAFDHSVPGTCVNLTALWFVDGLTFIICDVAILVVPMPVINSLRLGRRSKAVLMVVFAVGGFVCVTSILRLTTLKQGSGMQDPTWHSVITNIWSCVEADVGIVCACMPLLRKPLAILFPTFLSTTPSNNSDQMKLNYQNYETPKHQQPPAGQHYPTTLSSAEDNTEKLFGNARKAEVTVEGFPVGCIRGSEENIVGIRSTTEISVTTDGRKREADVEVGLGLGLGKEWVG